MLEYMMALTHWHWFGLATALVILEVLVGASFFLLWLGICACIIAILLSIFPEIEWQFQLLIFSVQAVACIVYWRFNLKNKLTVTDKPNLNRRSEQYIGKVFTLADPIENGRGKIQVDDSFWKVEGPDLPVGTKIKVIGVDGVILKVDAES
jgi:inner membrane protein